jgi:hypothetical protein
MPYLAAAVALVGLLGLLNLLLMVGVIRRLREHHEPLPRHAGPGVAVPSLLGPGDEVGDFSSVTVDGEPLTRGVFSEQTLVGFFSPDCGPCHELLPSFVTYAARMPEGRRQVLAVLTGDATTTAGQVSTLDGVARVVLERPGGQLGTAFRNEWYPALYLVGPDGRVQASGNRLDALLADATADA